MLHTSLNNAQTIMILVCLCDLLHGVNLFPNCHKIHSRMLSYILMVLVNTGSYM